MFDDGATEPKSHECSPTLTKGLLERNPGTIRGPVWICGSPKLTQEEFQEHVVPAIECAIQNGCSRFVTGLSPGTDTYAVKYLLSHPKIRPTDIWVVLCRDYDVVPGIDLGKLGLMRIPHNSHRARDAAIYDICQRSKYGIFVTRRNDACGSVGVNARFWSGIYSQRGVSRETIESATEVERSVCFVT